jgi:inorganic triphosphatase YgiF
LIGSPLPREAFIGTEIELKLAARRGDLPALTRALEGMAARPGPSRSKLVSTYYDSAERALARHSLTLRVRKAGTRYIQTVKSAGANGGSMLGRGEWEDEVAGERPDLGAAQTGRFLSPEIGPRLQPVFCTNIVRVTIPLAPAPQTRIEAAIDRGDIRAPARDRTETVSEIELELLEGPPAALYDVALQLLEVAPLRLGLRSKAERGYRLAAHDRHPADAAHFGGVALDPEEDGEALLQGFGRACLTQLLGSEAAALAGEAEGVHQMRVALRRLRAILSAFSMLIPKDRRDPLDGEVKWLTKALGDARNYDVFAEETIGSAKKAAVDGAGLDRLCKAAERRRRAAYVAARQAIRSPRYTALLLRLMRWFDGRQWRDEGGNPADERLTWPVRELAPLVLDKRRRTAKRHSHGFAGQSPEERHELRIALKKLRYTIELFAGLYETGTTKPFIHALKRLQDKLGDANDLQTGRKLIGELVPARRRAPAMAQSGQRLLAWHARRIAKAEPKLRDHVQELFAVPRFWQPAEAAKPAAE